MIEKEQKSFKGPQLYFHRAFSQPRNLNTMTVTTVGTTIPAKAQRNTFLEFVGSCVSSSICPILRMIGKSINAEIIRIRIIEKNIIFISCRYYPRRDYLHFKYTPYTTKYTTRVTKKINKICLHPFNVFSP